MSRPSVAHSSGRCSTGTAGRPRCALLRADLDIVMVELVAGTDV
jgi:hypothetical protein